MVTTLQFTEAILFFAYAFRQAFC